ncbi:ASB_collapsed_G0005780.mRNA.1.CDS.1 [Saccharomyces cerevisiae]|nr:ASB_collapsed_G0005780.mRNA.1.CDS.1 [Saccharomyces cerevisiae]
MLVVVLQGLAGFLSIIAILYQKRYNKLHRSIYGLSYDLYLLDFVGNGLYLYCALHYCYSSLVREQLSQRFPLFYPLNEARSIPISSLLILKDFCVSFCCLMVLRQLYYYRSTKHIYQGISITSIIFIGVFLVLGIFTYGCSISNLPLKNSGKFGVFYLDHINYLWVMANLLKCFKYVPQMSINWMGCSTVGLSSKFVLISFLAEFIDLVGRLLIPTSVLFYEIPFNSTPFWVKLIQFVTLSVILCQVQYVYVGRKPRLPKGKL